MANADEVEHTAAVQSVGMLVPDLTHFAWDACVE